MMLYLYVLDAQTDEKIPANVAKVTTADLKATKDWQTVWLSKAADQMPNKVALHRTDNGELWVLCHMRSTVKIGQLRLSIWRAPGTVTRTCCGKREHKKSIWVSQGLCSHMPLAFPLMRVFLAFWFSKRKPRNCWNIISGSLAQDRLVPTTPSGRLYGKTRR